MGRAAKTQRATKRKNERKAAKEAKKALYHSYSEAGHSKRKTRRGHRTFNTHSHPNGKCGNIGCKTCNPRIYNLLTPSERAKVTNLPTIKARQELERALIAKKYT